MSRRITFKWNDDAFQNWMARGEETSPRPGTSYGVTVTEDQAVETPLNCLNMKNVTMRRGRRRSRSVNASKKLSPEAPRPQQSVTPAKLSVVGSQGQVSSAEMVEQIPEAEPKRKRPCRKSKSLESRGPRGTIGNELPKKYPAFLEQVKLVEKSIEQAKQVTMKTSVSGTENNGSQNSNSGNEASEVNDSKEPSIGIGETTTLKDTLELHEFEIMELQISLQRLKREQKTNESETEDEEERIYGTPAYKKRGGIYFE